MNRGLRQIFCVVVLLLFAGRGLSQIEVSSGIDLSYPVLLNSNNTKLNYGQIGFGLRFGVAYKPAETQFFPILNFSFGQTRLPLKQFGSDVAALTMPYINVMLNENYIVRFERSELFIYGGVGFSDLGKRKITIAGAGSGAMQAAIDSTAEISHVFPAINVGFEYNYGESAGKPLYLTMGINFQYILLLQDRNEYSITVNDKGTATDYKANLSGNLISPGFYIALHYLVPKHKGNSMYLN